ITATFGEYRRGHFHAGTDFSTERHIGKPVYAPASGEVQRVQSSGSGFGNNLMIRTRDGRSILLAHLDAFDEPIASYLAAVQESTGRYDQTLQPEPGRFPVTAGQRVAWSGESGAGPPHLHMEIRFGDLAYNPLRFGLSVPDSSAPLLHRVILEPLDDSSYVRGSAAPRTLVLGPGLDTVVVQGRVRAWAAVTDGVSSGSRVAPYTVGLDWDGKQVECRFDRIAWDDQMPAVDWVYDGAGRVGFWKPIALWFGADYRPAMMRSSSQGPIAGVLAVGPGDPPRMLTLRAADAAGNGTERRLVLRPPRAGETFPATAARGRPARRFELMPVDGPFVRVRFSGAPVGSREVMVGLEGKSQALRPASPDGNRWVAVVRVPLGASSFVATGRTASGPWEEREPVRIVPVSAQQEAVLSAERDSSSFAFTIPERAVFASTFLVVDTLGTPAATTGLAPRSAAFEVGPATLPILRPARVELSHRGAKNGGELYRLRGGWAALSSGSDSEDSGSELGGSEASASVRGLGRFAMFEDQAAPRVGPVRQARIPTPAPNAWSLRCSVSDRGSGIDPSQTRFEIDGRRVPSEWDPERATLRWRPRQRPAAGSHDYVVVAVDRAGHETRASGKFVVR
ncbi:MAG TPA: M23 family metallopeptidase, partial [Candidatus Eisenbacteria bacterium]|nr:M23 family metallopeptidase [Candidatus Eisenbacteria bacterium]